MLFFHKAQDFVCPFQKFDIIYNSSNSSNYFYVGYMIPSFSSLILQLIRLRFQYLTSNTLNIGSTAQVIFNSISPSIQKNKTWSYQRLFPEYSKHNSWAPWSKKIVLIEWHLTSFRNFHFSP